MLKQFIRLQSFLLVAVFLPVQNVWAQEKLLKQIKLPEGFEISVFASDIENPRSMALAENGIVFVGSFKAGKVYALQDSNGDGSADKRYVITENRNVPNGVAYRDGSLYVAEINRILRFDNILTNLANPPVPNVIYDDFPTERHHGWKYLRFGPDGKLYTAVGAPCNICNPENPVFTSLVRLNPDGSEFEMLARGIRNTVGFDWQPDTGYLFFSDNGRDHMGDDIPPDELNKWTKKGEHFGYPFCHAGDIADPEFGKLEKCEQFVAPQWRFGAHVAALGLHFYRGRQFPESYRDQLFVAQHGSWNRSEPDGYRVVLVRFKDGQPVSQETFADGWLRSNNEVIGRPVDIIVLPDGSMLISDDKADVIYRVSYSGHG